MFEVILVAYDGSQPAQACADLATACALRWHAKLVFCYALDAGRLLVPAVSGSSGSFDVLDIYRREAANVLVDQVRKSRAAGAECESALMDDEYVTGILAAAAQSQAQLIAVGTHGRSGAARAMLGSVAEGVLRASKSPVLSVRSDELTGAFERVVVAIDDSPCAAGAGKLGRDIARADGSTLHLLNVENPAASLEHRARGFAALESARKSAQASGAGVQTHHERGEDAGSAICGFAHRIQAQLIVIGSHGRKGLARALLGSVAEAVVRHAPCPVLVSKDAG